MKKLKNGLIIAFFLNLIINTAYCQKVISGKVESEYWGPISALIKVEGSSLKTFSNNLGEYSIEIDSSHNVLNFQYIQHDNLSIKIDEKTQIDVVLKHSPIELVEVIIIGASISKKPVFCLQADTVFDKRNRIANITRSAFVDTMQSRLEWENQYKVVDKSINFNSLNQFINARNGNNSHVSDRIWNKFRHYLASTIIYPDIARKNGIMGKVITHFTINEFGKVEDIKIIRGIDDFLNEAVISAIKNTPEDIFARMTGTKLMGEDRSIKYLIQILFFCTTDD